MMCRALFPFHPAVGPAGTTVPWSSHRNLSTSRGRDVVRRKGGCDAHELRSDRKYDPAPGRFTQEDPIGLAGGLNLYGFAGGDPVNFSDPFGLCPENQGGTKGGGAWLGDCPKDSKGASQYAWLVKSSGAAEATDDPLFFFFGGLEVRGGRALFATGKLLTQHFEKHGAEFGVKNAAQYLHAAQKFFGGKGVETAMRGTDKLFYNQATNEFGVLRANGVIRTYFKPQEGRAYFDKITGGRP